jgi:tetratricopeptide (TPR) repeat protein
VSILFGPVSTEEQYQCDVFVIMPFRDEFRQMYVNIIKVVCDELNLVVKLGDDFFSNRQIINEIWSAINNCSIVIADCTGRNANVFYELGLAHTLGKNTIILTKDEKDIPFDIQGIRHIPYTDSIQGGNELKTKLRQALERVIASVEGSIEIDTSNLARNLKSKDLKRYSLALSKDANILKEETRKANKLNEYDWMEFFAEAWINVEPGNTRAYEDLATALIRSNQPQQAITVGEKLINLSKLNHVGYHTIGEAYNLKGEWENAVKWLELARSYASPTFKQFVLNDLLEAYEGSGLIDKAIEILEELIPLQDKFLATLSQEKLDHLKNIRKN